MKKLLVMFAAVALMFGSWGFAQAVLVTVTFDEDVAVVGEIAGEQWSDMGIHFIDNWMAAMFGMPPRDGYVYSPGGLYGIPGTASEYPAGTIIDPSRYLGTASTHPDGTIGNNGIVLQFDKYQTEISLEAYGIGGSSGPWWIFDSTIGTGFGNDLGGGSYTYAEGWHEYTYGIVGKEFDVILIAGSTSSGDFAVAWDNITFDAVPIPASVLLLGTGLLPLLRLRKRA